MHTQLIDRTCLIVTVASLLATWILFWTNTADPIGSLAAASITAGLVFLAYVVFRMLWLTFR